MKKKWKGKSVLLLGSGGLRIGQAGEFDYSGSQAIKAFKEEGVRIILVNPNIATVQTDDHMADELYLEPLQVKSVTEIIKKERPDGLLLGFGGQTALNLGLELEENGVLDEYNIEILGTATSNIRKAEDRWLFKNELDSVGIKTAKSRAIYSLKEAKEALNELGLPLMMRSAFSLGGLGSGVVFTKDALLAKVKEALSSVNQVLLEEYLCGWKEIEYEVIRDAKGQALVICNMENLDPMGIHTGESIVVAPSQTLNDSEFQTLRSISIQVANHFNVLGECNVQFALNPKDGDYRVIEMNPRLSRSSALASKATGYPIAFVAAKLSLGFYLDEIRNSITKKTTAFFEPALDYVAVKIPRWDIQKMRQANRTIGTEMKSVGEIMALGRSFPEALQKGIRMLNIGSQGISDAPSMSSDLESQLKNPTDTRIFSLYRFFLGSGDRSKAHDLTQIDYWFLDQINDIANVEKILKEKKEMDPFLLKLAKKNGFSDRYLASIFKCTEVDVRSFRIENGIVPCVKQIDTFAGEFEAETNYLYFTYHGDVDDLKSSNDAYIILGSGPYSIGSSVEFDWCAVNTARTLRREGEQAIIINSNPETVSTDFDESDRLYFEELSLERVLDICSFENPKGVIVSVGGQASNNLALPLYEHGMNILGTSPLSIDMAENRQKFSTLLLELDINQPQWTSVTSLESAKNFAKDVKYPLLLRPSYVLSGAAMHVVYNDAELDKYLDIATNVSRKYPVVLSKFIKDAKELDIDGVAEKGKIVIEAISEHVENAGIHSGDATVVLPPQKLYLETVRKAKNITKEIIRSLEITGPFNIQFIAKDNELQVIECNLRASRSFPFVSKVTGYNFIQIATEIFLGTYKKKHYETLELDYVGVKVPQFSYHRLKGADPVTDVEMNSTGEVACLGKDFLDAFFRSWLSTEQAIKGKRLLVSVTSQQKRKFLSLLKELEKRHWTFYATEGTHDFLTRCGVGSFFVFKMNDGMTPHVGKIIEDHGVDLIINIPSKRASAQSDGYRIRRLAIDHRVPIITNLHLAEIFLKCLIQREHKENPIMSYKEYFQPDSYIEETKKKKYAKSILSS